MPELKETKRNVAIEDEGEEVELNRFPGWFVTVRSSSYEPYRREISKKSAPLVRRLRQTELPDPIKTEEVEARAIVKHLLLGCRGFTSDGKEVTLEQFGDLITVHQREYRELFEDVRDAAAKVGEADADERETREKN